MKDIGMAEIMNILSSTGMRYNDITGYFIGNKYTKAKVDDNIIVIDNIYWNIKRIERLS